MAQKKNAFGNNLGYPQPWGQGPALFPNYGNLCVYDYELGWQDEGNACPNAPLLHQLGPPPVQQPKNALPATLGEKSNLTIEQLNEMIQ